MGGREACACPCSPNGNKLLRGLPVSPPHRAGNAPWDISRAPAAGACQTSFRSPKPRETKRLSLWERPPKWHPQARGCSGAGASGYSLGQEQHPLLSREGTRPCGPERADLGPAQPPPLLEWARTQPLLLDIAHRHLASDPSSQPTPQPSPELGWQEGDSAPVLGPQLLWRPACRELGPQASSYHPHGSWRCLYGTCAGTRGFRLLDCECSPG